MDYSSRHQFGSMALYIWLWPSFGGIARSDVCRSGGSLFWFWEWNSGASFLGQFVTGFQWWVNDVYCVLPQCVESLRSILNSIELAKATRLYSWSFTCEIFCVWQQLQWTSCFVNSSYVNMDIATPWAKHVFFFFQASFTGPEGRSTHLELCLCSPLRALVLACDAW